MFCLRWLFFFLLTLLASGCGKTSPVATENPSNPDSNISLVSSVTTTALSLAPSLPNARSIKASPTSSQPSRKGLTVLDSSSHDFGEVKQNAQLRHDFVLTNNVDVPIRIVGMKSSCSCTWSEGNDRFVGSEIAPKQKIDIPIFLNTGTLQDKASGQIAIIYRYQSDDPKWSGDDSLTLEVSGTLLPDYRIEPLDLSFGEIHALETQTAKRSFRVTPVQRESLEILDIKSSSNLYTTNILSSGKEGYEVEVTFDGSSLANSETVGGHLIIETDSQTVPRGLVTLAATYLAPLTAEPSFILISSDTEGTVQEKVQITSSVPFQILKVNVGATDLIHADFDSILKADEHIIAFSINPCREAEIDETITVEIILFPAGRESMTQTVPVTIYRFYKQGDHP